MSSNFSSSVNQLKLSSLLFNHFYIGVAITLFYVLVGQKILDLGYPSFTALIAAEVLILLPLATLHFYVLKKELDDQYPFRKIFVLSEKMNPGKFFLWVLGGVIVILLIYAPLYPVGIFLRGTVFGWLPEWYFNPSAGTDDLELIANMFLIGLFVDGLIGPTIEELFFRGYLLPRMAFLKKWAPVINGLLFGIYHFWQPHNIVASAVVGIILSYIVWKKKNMYLGIVIHCIINILGALTAYLATINGVLINR